MTSTRNTNEREQGRDARGERPLFYWEVPAEHRARLRDENSILEDEGYLAHDINRGRRMLDVPDTYESVPDVSRDWEPPRILEQMSDAVSAILQVAVDAGFNPVDVCEAALLTQRGVRNGSAAAIRTDR